MCLCKDLVMHKVNQFQHLHFRLIRNNTIFKAIFERKSITTSTFYDYSYLTFRSPPEQPKWWENENPESLIHGKYADRYELRWRVPANNGEPIDMYEISYCPVSFFILLYYHIIFPFPHTIHTFSIDLFGWFISLFIST